MKPSYGTSFVLGAVTGLIVAEALLLFFASMGAVQYLNPAFDTGSVDPVFSVPASAMWSMVSIAGLIGGALIAAVTRGVGRVIDPDAHGAPTAVVITLGAVVGAVVALAVFPISIGAIGTIADGVATMRVLDMVLLVGFAGIAGGGAIAWMSYLLTRPPVHEDDPELLAA